MKFAYLNTNDKYHSLVTFEPRKDGLTDIATYYRIDPNYCRKGEKSKWVKEGSYCAGHLTFAKKMQEYNNSDNWISYGWVSTIKAI